MNANFERMLIREYEGKRFTKTPKGYVPVLVGDINIDEIKERYFVHIKMLKEPSIIALFEKAAEEFGYRQEGILMIPCGVEQFRRTINRTSREKY